MQCTRCTEILEKNKGAAESGHSGQKRACILVGRLEEQVGPALWEGVDVAPDFSKKLVDKVATGKGPDGCERWRIVKGAAEIGTTVNPHEQITTPGNATIQAVRWDPRSTKGERTSKKKDDWASLMTSSARPACLPMAAVQQPTRIMYRGNMKTEKRWPSAAFLQLCGMARRCRR